MPGVRSFGYWMPEQNVPQPQQTHAVQVEVNLQVCAAAESKLGRLLGKFGKLVSSASPQRRDCVTA